MNDQRFQELMRKRDSSGLTGDEANELGRMMAERDGAPYSNASKRDHFKGQTDEEHSDVQDAPEEAEKAR
jgi:hypothetical protein